MKDARVKLRDFLLAEIASARESAAAPLTPEKIRESLTAAARQGFAECRIAPAAPVEVRHTKVAAAAEAFLDTNRLAYVWEATMPAVLERREEYHVLVVTMK